MNENEIKFNDFYLYNKIFNKDTRKEKTSSSSQNIIDKSSNLKTNNKALIEYKESLIKRFINAIKKILKK